MKGKRTAACPFCGGPSQAVLSIYPPSSVVCMKCRARVYADEVGTAIERWNRRVINVLHAERGEDVRGDLAPVPDDASTTPTPSPDACNLPLRAPHIDPEGICEQCGQQAQVHRHWRGV